MITRSLLTVPYHITRTPLVLVDVQLARRLPEDSPPRQWAERVLGSYDRIAGRLLSDPDLAQRGLDRVTRSSKLANAVALEREATQRREEAETKAEAGRRQAAKTAEQADAKLVDGLKKADATERDGKRAAAADARAAAARKKKQAEQRTARQLAGVEQKVNRAEKVANSRAASARKTAKTKLDDVAGQRATARAKRNDADQLAELTTAKRQARTKA